MAAAAASVGMPGVAAAAAGVGITTVVGASVTTSQTNKHIRNANKAQEKASLELEKKWEDEKRWKVYNEGKVKGGKRK